MARNAWRVWGISVAMAGSLIAADKPAELPVRTEVQGRSTPTVTEEHFQAEKAPPPRLLPAQIREGNPTKDAPPNAIAYRTEIGSFLEDVSRYQRLPSDPGLCVNLVALIS